MSKKKKYCIFAPILALIPTLFKSTQSLKLLKSEKTLVLKISTSCNRYTVLLPTQSVLNFRLLEKVAKPKTQLTECFW